MSGPWERYSDQPTGPWAKYAQSAPVAPVQAAPPVDYRGEGGGRGTALEAALIGARQGVTFGFGDEINAGVRAAGDWLGGEEFGKSYERRLEHERGLLDQTKRENPVAETAGEIGGSVLLPGGAAGSATTLGGAAIRGAGAGAAAGAAYGAGNAEGGAGERLEGAAEGAALGGLFGAGANAAVYGGTKAVRAVMRRSVERPSLGTMKAAKNAAYRAVDEAGEVFEPAELQGMAAKAREAIEGGNYVPGTDKQTDAALTLLDRNAAKPMKMGQLDKLRQDLWKRYNAAPNEAGILDAIDAIDETIASKASTNELMQTARAANARYKKAEMLEAALKKATDQTSSSGSGGNVLNKYRQTLTAIINDPKRAKWFNAEEKAVMQQLIDGSGTENVMRKIGKLSPDGNGLMLALNLLGGASFGAPSLAVTAAGTAAKAYVDTSARRAADDLMGVVATGNALRAPDPVKLPYRNNALTGWAAGQ